MVSFVSIPPLVDWPACVTRTRLNCGRAQLAAIEVGTARQTLLVPGFTGSKEDFLPLLHELDQRGISALAYDQLGQFESRGTNDSSEYTIDRLADDLIAVARGMDKPPHLVGHSMGGLVSRLAVIRRPEAFASLTLMCSGPHALPVQNQGKLKALQEALHGMTMEQIWQAKLQLEEAEGIAQPDPQTLDLLARRWVENNPFAMAQMAQILASEPDRVDELRSVLESSGLSVLVMAGVDDQENWPTAVQSRMAERLGTELEIVPDAAHSPAVENPVQTATVLSDFWASA